MTALDRLRAALRACLRVPELLTVEAAAAAEQIPAFDYELGRDPDPTGLRLGLHLESRRRIVLQSQLATVQRRCDGLQTQVDALAARLAKLERTGEVGTAGAVRLTGDAFRGPWGFGAARPQES